MTALAIEPGPKVPAPAFMWSSLAIGPCTMSRGATGMRRGLQRSQIEARFEHRFDRRHQDRQVLRPASGHDGIDGDLLDGCDAAARRHDSNDILGAPSRAPDHLATAWGVGAMTGNPSLERRSKNHACSSAGSAGASMRCARKDWDAVAGAGTFASSVRTFAYNFSARSTICRSESPPSGCVNSAIRASGNPRARPSCSALG